MGNERVAKWDNVKFILMIFVVVGHFAMEYARQLEDMWVLSFIIYTFHMPAFVFVSGLFSKSTVNSEKFPLKRIIPFVEMYLFMKITIYVINALTGRNTAFHLFREGGIPWYMLAVAIWYSATWVFKRFDKKYIFAFAFAAGCLIGYDSKVSDFLSLSRVITFYPFFLAGYYMDANRLLEKVDKKKTRIFSAVLLVAFVALIIIFRDDLHVYGTFLTARRPFTKLEPVATYGGALRIGYYLITALVIFAFISVCPTGETFFTKFGSRTLQVYALHRQILYLIVDTGFVSIIKSVGTGWEWLFVSIGILLTFLLSTKYISKPFGILMHPKVSR